MVMAMNLHMQIHFMCKHSRSKWSNGVCRHRSHANEIYSNGQVAYFECFQKHEKETSHVIIGKRLTK